MGRTLARIGVRIAIGIGVVAAGTSTVPGWERSVTGAVVDLPGGTTPVLRTVMQAGTRAAPVVLAVVLAVAFRWRWRAVAVLGAGVLGWAVAEWSKGWFDRARPTAATLGRPIRDVVHGPGYPSNHTAVATALCVAVLVLADRRRPAVVVALVAVPVLTGLGRVHVGAHWLLDVVGGAIIGVTAGRLVAAMADDRP